jgi:hypothetical protein
VVLFAGLGDDISNRSLEPVKVAFDRPCLSGLEVTYVRFRMHAIIFGSTIVKQPVVTTETYGKQALFIRALSYDQRARDPIATNWGAIKVLVNGHLARNRHIGVAILAPRYAFVAVGAIHGLRAILQKQNGSVADQVTKIWGSVIVRTEMSPDFHPIPGRAVGQAAYFSSSERDAY